MKMFDEFARFNDAEVQFKAFGLAGQAIVLNREGKFAEVGREAGRSCGRCATSWTARCGTSSVTRCSSNRKALRRPPSRCATGPTGSANRHRRAGPRRRRSRPADELAAERSADGTRARFARTSEQLTSRR